MIDSLNHKYLFYYFDRDQIYSNLEKIQDKIKKIKKSNKISELNSLRYLKLKAHIYNRLYYSVNKPNNFSSKNKNNLIKYSTKDIFKIEKELNSFLELRETNYHVPMTMKTLVSIKELLARV